MIKLIPLLSHHQKRQDKTFEPEQVEYQAGKHKHTHKYISLDALTKNTHWVAKWLGDMAIQILLFKGQ